jgi:hypothetical protein
MDIKWHDGVRPQGRLHCVFINDCRSAGMVEVMARDSRSTWVCSVIVPKGTQNTVRQLLLDMASLRYGLPSGDI